jgi:hypothetical protein
LALIFSSKKAKKKKEREKEKLDKLIGCCEIGESDDI